MSNTYNIQGPGLLSMLTVLFVALKLLGKISWSWWWVLAPTWISLIIVLVILLIGFIVWLFSQ